MEPSDDRMLAGLALFVGAVRLALAIGRGETFGVEATLAILMCVLGSAGLRRSA